MKTTSEKTKILEDLTIAPGTGASMSVGSDCYAYWITDVLPNRVLGVCSARSHFDKDHPWEDGHEVVEPWNPEIDKTEFFIKRCYNHWWKVSEDGKKRISRFDGRWQRFSIGHAVSYRDPSF